jgi:nicotinamidase-related amidase
MNATEMDAARSALLLLDCQEGVAARVLTDRASRAAFCAAVESAVEAAQSSGMPCVRVEVEFRPGHPEVSASNAYFSKVREAQRMVAGSEEAAPMSELAALMSSMPRVVKRRIGGFANTDLGPLLRGLGCDGVVLSGLITSGAVLSTAAHGADLDYRVAVLSDASHDPNPGLHEALLEHALPMRAQVVTVSEFAGSR